jgi:signal transduction histidine kinase
MQEETFKINLFTIPMIVVSKNQANPSKPDIQIPSKKSQKSPRSYKLLRVSRTQQVQSKLDTESQLDTELKLCCLESAVHELQQPLTCINFVASLLTNQQEALTEAQKQKYYQLIQQSTKKLRDLLEEILAFGKMDSNEFEPVFEPVDMVDFLREQIEAWQMVVDAHTFTLSVQGNGFLAWLDPKLLWHVCNNLLSNAVKYSPKGGKISLLLSADEDKICFQVKDEGIGIPPSAQATLFTPFKRASNVGNIPGSGLGLAIAKRCLDLHNGQIAVESSLEQGTIFTATLPKTLRA